MEKIDIKPLRNLPKVYFDGLNGHFEICGSSYPQNAELFYLPLVEYVSSYIKKPQAKTLLVCQIDYFQTTSEKHLIDIIKILRNVKKNGFELDIDWVYVDEDDSEDIIITGKEIEALVKVKFNFKKKNKFSI